MSGGLVFRSALGIVNGLELPAVARRDVVAVMDDSRPGPLDFVYQAGLDAKLDRESILSRAAAIYLNHCAGQIADDISDGGCTSLEEPAKTGPAVQFILQNLFFATLAKSGIDVDVIAAAAEDMARAAGPQQIEVRTEKWTAPLAIEVAEGLGGLQYGSYLRLLWAGSQLEERASRFGRALGVVLHVATDIASEDPRYTTLPESDRLELIGLARSAAESLRSEGLGCLDLVLPFVDRTLEQAA